MNRPRELEPAVQLALGDWRTDRPDPEPAPPATGVGARHGEQECRVLVVALARHGGARLYRERFDLRSDYPLVAPSYAALRSEFARQNRVGPQACRPRRLQRRASGRPTERKMISAVRVVLGSRQLLASRWPSPALVTCRRPSVFSPRPAWRVPLLTARSMSRTSACRSAWSDRVIVVARSRASSRWTGSCGVFDAHH